MPQVKDYKTGIQGWVKFWIAHTKFSTTCFANPQHKEFNEWDKCIKYKA